MKNKICANKPAVILDLIAKKKKIVLTFLFLLLISNGSFAAVKTWAIAGGGAWTTPANWGGAIPVAGDDIIFNNAANITVTAVPTISLNSISVQGTANVILQGGAGVVLTINNTNATVALNIVNARTLTIGGGAAANAVNLTFQTITTATTIAGTLVNTANSSVIINASQTLTIAGTGTYTANAGTNTVNGSISNAGTVNGGAGNLSFAAGSTYIHNQNAGTLPTATWNATSNCNITGITNATLAGGLNQTFGNLTIDGSSTLIAAVTLAQSGNVIIQGNLIITGRTVLNTISLNPAGNNLTVTGTTTVNVYGLLVDNNNVGTNTFTGAVTINTNGALSTGNTSPYTFSGGITCNGLFNQSAAGNITLNGNQTINNAGSNPMTITGNVTNSAPLIITNTSSSITFAGTFTNNNSLTITNSAQTTITGAFTTTANVLLNGTAPLNFNNTYTITGAFTVTNQNTNIATVAGNMTGSVAGSTWVNSANSSLYYGGANQPFNGNGTLTVTANPNIVNYNLNGVQTIKNTNYNILTLSGNNTKTINGATVATSLNLNGAATLAVGANSLTATTVTRNNAIAITISTGTFTVNGDLLLNAADPITFSGAGLLSVSGNLNCGVITEFANSNVIVSGNLNSGNIGGAVTAILTVGGNLTCATLTGSSSTINIGGTFGPTIYTINTSTVNYNAAGSQNVSAFTYYNLTVSGGGSKVLQGAVVVNNNLNLSLASGGTLQLGGNDLTLASINAVVAGAPFSATNMIETNSNGHLIRSLNATNASFNGTYPVGSGGYYNPVVISGLVGAVAAARSVSIRAVPSNPGVYSNTLNKYWDITAAGLNYAAQTISFQYNLGEVIGIQTVLLPYTNISGSWQIAPTPSAVGVNPITSTGSVTFTGQWTAGAPGTFYSYQSGPWNASSTWTSDPGGTTQVGATVPGTNDIVVILSGRTVTLPANIAASGLDVTINNGGFLDLSTFQFTAGLLALRGQGTLKSSLNFPNPVTTNTFIIAGGGTTEYNANVNLPAQATYNNLTINTSGTVVQLNNTLTLNGNLYVKQGTYQINDNSGNRRQLIISGNVTVDNGASITVGTGNTITVPDAPTTVPVGGVAPFINYYDHETHRIVVNGDFINNGTVRLTNQTYPQYDAFPANGAASVYFQGASDNTLTCNGTTDFYNLIIDKGIDQTFKLTIYSSDYSNFRLFGANITAGDNPQAANSNLRKALWIRTGTLDLTGLTIIPSLTEGATVGPPTSDFFIPANAAMVIDGPDVVVLSTADDYREVNAAYGLAGGSNAAYGINTTGGHSALSILGKLQVNDGYLSTRESAGLTYWNFAPGGQLIMNGGIVDTKQIDDAAGGNNGLLTYIQTGGAVMIRGRFQHNLQFSSVNDLVNTNLNTTRLANGTDASAGSFNINSNAASGFSMSGGNMQIYDVCNNIPVNAFSVNCPTSNISVTGGNVQIIPTTGTGGDANYLINSLAPFWNLLINQVSSASIVQLNINPLTVLQNFSLLTSTQPGTFDANGLNIAIGGNFSIASAATYKSTGTTTFNGAANQTFTIDGTINNGTAGLSNLAINMSSGTLNIAGLQPSLIVKGTFDLTNGIFDDGGKSVYVAGNITNSGTHISTPGTGKIQLNGTSAQTIGGNGNGIFQNLELNNTTAANPAPVSLIAKITVSGTLNLLSNKIFNLANDPTIASYNLTIGPSGSITAAAFSNSCYIQSNGKSGDGGITKIYSSTSAFTFPVGAYSTKRPATYAYTPAIIGFGTAPSVYGSITVIPVGIVHPNANPNNLSLTYYWHVKSNGFTLGAGTVNQSYTYSITDVNSVEANYVPARFNYTAFTWSNGTTASVNTVAHNFGPAWLTGTNFIDGDYTAGTGAPTNPFGAQKIFYSYNCPAPAGGLWDNAATWSLTSHTVYSNPTNAVPGANDIVLIGNNDSVYLNRPTPPPASNPYTHLNFDPRSCANLQIASGAALDIGWNPACNFAIVSSSSLANGVGNGNFRLCTDFNSTTYVFPSGDFSDFNANKGTTEFYTTNAAAGGTYYLPQGVTSYGNLILSPVGGSNVIFANNNLTIYGNLITRGENADSWFCPAWTGNYPTAPVVPVAKTITIMGNLLIQGGGLVFYGYGAVAQNVIVYGDVVVNPWGTILNWGSASNQSMAIGGSLINNTNNAMQGGTTTPSVVDFNTNGAIPVTFFGSNSAFIKNTAGTPGTTFNTVTVNKGNSQATTLTCNIGGTLTTALPDNWLFLQNGTFIYSRVGSNLNISTTTQFVIPATAGLYVSSSNNVIIGTAQTTVAPTLSLSGKLTLDASNTGTVLIGPNATTAYHDDIEYSSGGTSTIEVDGGTLIVNGQIRRNASNAAGILSYTQTGTSTVTILGNSIAVVPSNANNAKLEVLNNGSQFNMSGTCNLNIVRGGGITFGDLYLRPQNSSVTGGTINFVPGATGAQSYKLDANVPLNNVIVNGSAGNAATVQLMVSPLVVNGDFTLSNANSIFNAVNGSNNINVTFNGNLVNNGGVASYLYGTNLTTFSATAAAPYLGAQSVTGATNFYDVLVNPVTSLTLGSNATINRNLTISSGILKCGANNVAVKGNLTNNSGYTTLSNIAPQGITLSGISAQQISGTGSYGRLEINNAAGVQLTNPVTLQENLLLSLGIFNINQYLLSLGQSSTIQGAFSASNMIISDGVYSNVGIKKVFGIGAASFTYPIGTPGKYTPAILTITANTNTGYIRVNNINSKHPTVSDPANVLNYYWEVESYGIIGLSGNLVFNYSQGDVLGPNENSWVGAELVPPNWNLFPPGTGSVNSAANTITINYNNTSSISGEYTAGLAGAFPATIPIYTSNTDGNWDNINIWTPTSPVGGPNGFNVIINNNVTANVNYCNAYQTTINGDLIINSGTYGHNFGTVNGNGTLTLQSATFPAGRFSSFLDCINGGTLEYGGSTNYTLVADLYSSVHNLLFSGTGNRTLPNKDLIICNQLKINGPTVDNSVYKHKLTIMGTMERYNTGVFKSGSGSNATVTFAGTGAQSLGGATGDFTGTNGFNNFEINNAAGLTLNGSIDVNNNLLLTSGIIATSASNKLTINNTTIACVTPNGGSSTSFVNGPLIKKINQSDYFIFPIGQGNTFGHKFKLSATQAGTKFWTVQYKSPNTTSANMTGNLTAVNTQEFWTVKVLSGNLAIVNINWDPSSDITPLMTQNGLSDMRVADFNAGTGFWEEIASTASGNNNIGTVSTSSRVTIPAAGSYDFTIATINTTKPKARLNPAGPICGTTPDGGIPIAISTPNPAFNYTITYTIDNVDQAPVTITSLPYTLSTPSIGTYKLKGFKYNNGSSTGVVDISSVVVYAKPTTADAGTPQSKCDDHTTLAGNTPGVGTGLWSITSGAGGTFVDPTNPATRFNGINGNAYTLLWTITNFSCTSSSGTSVSFPLLPVQPSPFTASSASVCQGQSGVIYTVPNDPTVTYNWSYSGSGVTINGSTNSISLDFGVSASGGTLSVTATNGCGTSAPRSIVITVDIAPTATAGSDISVCTGMAAITMTGASEGGTYSSNNWSGGAGSGNWSQNANPALATFTPTISSGSFTATLTVTGSGGCLGTNPTSTRLITWATVTSISSDPSNSTIFAGQNTSFTVVPGGTGPFTYVWEVSTNSGGSWNPVSGGVYSGENTATLSITGALLSMNSYYYHCIVTGACGNATSNYGILTVNPTATASLSGTTSICVGKSATLTVTLTGTPNWSITYTDGTTPVTVNNIAASPYTFNVSPIITTTYTITAVSDVNGAGTISGGSVLITVTPVPATGPLYRKPNQ